MSTNRLRLFVIAFLSFASAALAQTPPETKTAHTIADVIQWVRRDGTDAIMSHDMAHIFEWGDANVIVSRMAFANPNDHSSVAFDVVHDRPNAVMIARNPNEMIVWQMSDAGKLLKTLYVSKAGATLVDNDVYLSRWRDTLNIFLEFIPPPGGAGH
jgi:hypothetical protein